MGYKKDIFAGLTWLGGARGFSRGLAFLKNILAARLLSPRDFGQFGAILLVTSLFEIVTTFGLRPIIIQEKKVSKEFLSTTWTFSIIRGILIALAVTLASPLISSFFGDPGLISLLMVVALAPLIKGFVNPGIILLQKELEFSRVGVLRVLVSSIEFLATIGAALVLGNVWALLFGFLTASLAELGLSFIISSYRPRLKLKARELRLIFQRGRWLVSSNIFNYSATQGDDIIVGRLLGLHNLGFYQLAYRLANLPLTEVAEVLSQVTLPIYSKISGDTKRLKRAFLKTTFYSTLLGSLAAIFLIVFAQPLIKFLLGERWLPMVPLLRILAVFAVLRSILENIRPLFFSRGDFKTIALFDAARTAILIALILPLINRYQTRGAAAAVLISMAAIFPWLAIKVKKSL